MTCGRSAGELALENGQAEVAKFICEYTADVNIRNKLQSTTLDTVEYGANEGWDGQGKGFVAFTKSQREAERLARDQTTHPASSASYQSPAAYSPT